MPIIRIQKMEVKLKRPLVDIPVAEFRRGLVKSPILDWLPAAIEGDSVIPEVAAVAPINGVDIVEWMQKAAAYSAVLEGMSEEYHKSGSELISRVGDGLIPSVGLGSGAKAVYFTSIPSSNVASQGGAYASVGGKQFLVPQYGKLTMITKDVLAWAAIPGLYAYQWLAALLNWVDLATSPIQNRIRFGSISRLTTPQFVIVKSTFPLPVIMATIGFTSNRQQKVAFQMRSPSDYTNVLVSDTLEIPAGESSLDYFIFGFPFVEPFVAHFQPEDNSEIILDSLTVTPP